MSVVEGRVLVLNKSWVAVNIATARRALVLLYQGHARAVHPSDYSLYDFEDWCSLSTMDDEALALDRRVGTVACQIALPEIILLSGFNGFIRPRVSFSRRNLFTRDKHQCQYCGKTTQRNELTIDHVMPRSRGGEDTWENLVAACMRCNVRKGNRTPEEAKMPLLSRPRVPKGLPRFGVAIPKTDLDSWHRFVGSTSGSVSMAE